MPKSENAPPNILNSKKITSIGTDKLKNLHCSHKLSIKYAFQRNSTARIFMLFESFLKFATIEFHSFQPRNPNKTPGLIRRWHTWQESPRLSHSVCSTVVPKRFKNTSETHVHTTNTSLHYKEHTLIKTVYLYHVPLLGMLTKCVKLLRFPHVLRKMQRIFSCNMFKKKYFNLLVWLSFSWHFKTNGVEV